MGSDGVFCFISRCKFGSFKNTFATITILSELTLDSEDFDMNRKKDFYGPWQHHKQLKKPWRWVKLDLILLMRDIYINSNVNLPEFTSSSRSTEFKLWSNDQEDHCHQHTNSQKPCDETEHSVVNTMESKWKLRQQHDQNSPMDGKPL